MVSSFHEPSVGAGVDPVIGGAGDGALVKAADGATVDPATGARDGALVGAADGATVDPVTGAGDGAPVGAADGAIDGAVGAVIGTRHNSRGGPVSRSTCIVHARHLRVLKKRDTSGSYLAWVWRRRLLGVRG